jgi:uncharacterized protein YceK
MRALLISTALVLLGGCGSVSTIPVPSAGSFTVTDAAVTVCTTVPLAALGDAGAAKIP